MTGLDSGEWSRYHSAAKLAPPERGVFLPRACEGDAELQAEVELLLAGGATRTGIVDAARRGDTTVTVAARLGPGASLGPYHLEEVIGEGGMGRVYRARDTRLGREVAIKVLSPGKAADQDRKRRFMQEARAASALNHPNIVTVHDIANDSGIDYTRR